MTAPSLLLFDPVLSDWVVLGSKTCAEIPVSTGGTAHDPWQIAGETPDPPDGTNDESGGSEYANASATEPGHGWPFMGLGATIKATGGGYYPANRGNEGINHYRRGFRLAPRMFGSDGRLLRLRLCGLLMATDPANVLDILVHANLVTALPATTVSAGQYVAFRIPLGVVAAEGSAETPYVVDIEGQPMGPHKSVWTCHARGAAQTAPESTAPTLNLHRGPILLDLTSAGIDMDTTGAQMAVLFAARSSGCDPWDFDDDGGAAQDGSEVVVKMGGATAMLSPRRRNA